MAVANETVIKECGKDPYRVRVAVRGEAGAFAADSCAAGQLADYHERGLGDQHEAEGPLSQPKGLAQPGVLEVEARPEVVAAGSQERDQYGGLGGNAQS
jgi:hypothetical protein